ncbi:hypothetical protein CCHR01_14836 [Colletotrichum chrysophilum]|uniref:Uncharacterized protein n=1 Tax=Colletotrichum chrysophilum TaxID=1836956 RepID=A0AAD9EBX8_9PEZI|nr:hypothetical protein CCHR01_14836 [Colletotrichum chrysophilum]
MALVGPYLEAYDPEAQGVHEPAKYSVVKGRDLAQFDCISALLEAAKHMGLHDKLVLDVKVRPVILVQGSSRDRKIEFGLQGGRGRVVVHGHSPNGGAISDESTGSRFGSTSAFRADDVGGSGVGRSGVGPKDDREDDDDDAAGNRADDIGRSGVGPRDDRGDDDDAGNADNGGGAVGMGGLGCPEFRCSNIIATRSRNSPTKVVS